MAFTPPVVVSAWDRYDWAWNALTAGLLALTASFMVNIYSAFAAGDATVTTALIQQEEYSDAIRYLNTKEVVAGYNEERPADVDDFCRNLFTDVSDN